MSGTTAHWADPHMVADILAAARRPGAAEPTEIHVHVRIHTRLLHEADAPLVVDDRQRITALDGIRLVVDEEVPAFPGFEVHRAGGPPQGVAA
jgi:hypothetical protein